MSQLLNMNKLWTVDYSSSLANIFALIIPDMRFIKIYIANAEAKLIIRPTNELGSGINDWAISISSCVSPWSSRLFMVASIIASFIPVSMNLVQNNDRQKVTILVMIPEKTPNRAPLPIGYVKL